jgi:hypothetical protein
MARPTLRKPDGADRSFEAIQTGEAGMHIVLFTVAADVSEAGFGDLKLAAQRRNALAKVRPGGDVWAMASARSMTA